jgi:hypothetical protein
MKSGSRYQGRTAAVGSVRGPSLERTATTGTRRNRTFLSGMPASGVDPGPTFVSSPADRWVYRGTVIRIARSSDSRQLIEQGLRLFQIGGVEPLGEPAVDRC